MDNHNINLDNFKFLSELTGIQLDELIWMTKRIIELHKTPNINKHNIKNIIKEEAKDKPWLNNEINR